MCSAHLDFKNARRIFFLRKLACISSPFWKPVLPAGGISPPPPLPSPIYPNRPAHCVTILATDHPGKMQLSRCYTSRFTSQIYNVDAPRLLFRIFP